MAGRNISWLRTLIRKCGFLVPVTIDFCLVALMVLVASPYAPRCLRRTCHPMRIYRP